MHLELMINLKNFPGIITERLLLRQPSSTDAEALFRLRSDPQVNKYLERQPAETMQQVADFIESVNKNFSDNSGIYWVIINRESSQLIGTICLFNFSEEGNDCEIGYELLPDSQGNGFMTEALRKVLEFASQRLGIILVQACTHNENSNSIELLRKFNFNEPTVTNNADQKIILFQLEMK